MADDLIVSALRKAIERDTEFRLVAVGETPEDAGLFPDRKGPAKKAIQACREGDKPLLLVREEPGKGKTPNEFARVTDKGLTTLAAQTPLTQFPELIAAAAPLLRTRLIRTCLRSLGRRAGELDPWNHRRLVQACLKAAQSQFDSIETRLQELLTEEQVLGDAINEFLKTTRTRIEKQKERLTGELDSISKAATALISGTEATAAEQPKRPRLPEWRRVPATDAEIDFQKNQSEELIFAWQDATSPETQSALERALFNVGVERLNAPGDIVAFDGGSQHTDDDVAEGDPVEVVLPGWQLVNPRGTSLLARAKVIKTIRPVTHKHIAESPTAVPDDDKAPKTPAAARIDGKPDTPPPAVEPASSSAPTSDAEGGVVPGSHQR